VEEDTEKPAGDEAAMLGKCKHAKRRCVGGNRAFGFQSCESRTVDFWKVTSKSGLLRIKRGRGAGGGCSPKLHKEHELQRELISSQAIR
jgi:hypothetical protein